MMDERTIEIDDSGTGDLVGDAFIGFHVKETGEIIFRSIPVGLYNEANWKNQEPYKKAVEIVKKGLEALKFNKNIDTIYLCRGDCFKLVREYFENEGIDYIPSVIEGKLQDAVEGRLISHLRKLGVKSKSLTKKAGAKRYFILLNWLCRDFFNRERFVKTGFKSWRDKRRKEAIDRYHRYLESQKKQKGRSS
jgi:hypothetical protein